MKTSEALKRFQHSCHNHLACYTFAIWGLQEFVTKITAQALDKERTLWIGSSQDGHARAHAAVKIADVIKNSRVEGPYANQIAKSILTTIYAEWDEVYRHEVATERGVSAKQITSNLMGDLRTIRHCIIHKKSMISNEHTKLKELRWALSPGPLNIDREMFAGLIEQINGLTIKIAPKT